MRAHPLHRRSLSCFVCSASGCHPQHGISSHSIYNPGSHQVVNLRLTITASGCPPAYSTYFPPPQIPLDPLVHLPANSLDVLLPGDFVCPSPSPYRVLRGKVRQGRGATGGITLSPSRYLGERRRGSGSSEIIHVRPHERLRLRGNDAIPVSLQSPGSVPLSPFE